MRVAEPDGARFTVRETGWRNRRVGHVTECAHHWEAVEYRAYEDVATCHPTLEAALAHLGVTETAEEAS